MPKAEPAGGRWRASCPVGKRGADGRLSFKCAPHSSQELQQLIASFQPTVTPVEVLRAGSFGGTYFRDITSAVTGKKHTQAWTDLPAAWFKGLDIERFVARPWNKYDASVNKYGSKCGNTLEEWEKSGWINKQDPYGWFQWYCRFYLGRRSCDDERQIRRWANICGPTGRWKGNLVAKCLKQGRRFDDVSVAPVVRQSLLHWGYELTAADMRSTKGAISAGKGAYMMSRDELKKVHRRGSVVAAKSMKRQQQRRPAKRVAAAALQRRVTPKRRRTA